MDPLAALAGSIDQISGGMGSLNQQLANMTSLPEDVFAVPLAYYFLLPSPDRAARVVLFGLIAGFGVLSNLMSVVVLVRSGLVKGWTYAMLCNISVSDLLVCAISLLTYLPCVVADRFVFPEAVCYIRLALILTSAGGSIFSYLTMAVQRFTVIVLNRTQLRVFQVRWLPVLLAAIWAASSLFVTPYYYLGDVYAVYWRDNCFTYSDYAEMVMQAITMTWFYVSSAVILCLYVAIYVVVRRSSARMQVRGKRERKDAKMALVLFSLFSFFVVAYAPFCSFSSARPYLTVKAQERFLLTGMYTAISVSAINPIIYVFMFPQMKKGYRALFGCTEIKTTQVSSIS